MQNNIWYYAFSALFFKTNVLILTLNWLEACRFGLRFMLYKYCLCKFSGRGSWISRRYLVTGCSCCPPVNTTYLLIVTSSDLLEPTMCVSIVLICYLLRTIHKHNIVSIRTLWCIDKYVYWWRENCVFCLCSNKVKWAWNCSLPFLYCRQFVK